MKAGDGGKTQSKTTRGGGREKGSVTRRDGVNSLEGLLKYVGRKSEKKASPAIGKVEQFIQCVHARGPVPDPAPMEKTNN